MIIRLGECRGASEERFASVAGVVCVQGLCLLYIRRMSVLSVSIELTYRVGHGKPGTLQLTGAERPAAKPQSGRS